jgi:hypothetical protein
MPEIKIVHEPNEDLLQELNVFEWPIWSKEVSEFPWSYDLEEMCYLLSGEVTVTPKDGEPVFIQKGDLVTFPKGMDCTWKITSPVRKHYTFR